MRAHECENPQGDIRCISVKFPFWSYAHFLILCLKILPGHAQKLFALGICTSDFYFHNLSFNKVPIHYGEQLNKRKLCQ